MTESHLFQQFPILVVTYNRADTFSRLLSVLAGDSGREIFIFCDGPKNKRDEKEQVKILSEARKYEVAHLSRNEVNLGCKGAVEAALDWVFSLREGAIVLEDDLLPDPDFLGFCDAQLEAFRDDLRIQQVSGTNSLGRFGRVFSGGSLIFSPVPNVSGWATWDSRWRTYRAGSTDDYRTLSSQIPKTWIRYRLRKRWKEILENAADSSEGALDSWAYPWAAWGIVRGLATVVPPENLVEHHGFDSRATHTSEGRFVRSRPLRSRIRGVTFKSPSLLYEKTTHMLDIVWWAKKHYRKILRRKLTAALSGR